MNLYVGVEFRYCKFGGWQVRILLWREPHYLLPRLHKILLTVPHSVTFCVFLESVQDVQTIAKEIK